MKMKLLLASATVLLGIGASSCFQAANASKIMNVRIICPIRIHCPYPGTHCDGFSSHWKLDMHYTHYQPPYNYYYLSRIMTQRPISGIQAVCMYGTGTGAAIGTPIKGGYFKLVSTNQGFDVLPDRSMPGWDAYPNCVGGDIACPFIIGNKT